MTQINLSFISTIIDGYIKGVQSDFSEGFISEEEAKHTINTLEKLKNTYKEFIRETNEIKSK